VATRTLGQIRRDIQKFGETFRVINRDTIGGSYGRTVWEDNPQCIASVDFVARQDDVINLLRDVHWDLCIVDEARKMAAYRYGQKASKTQRYKFGEFLRDRADHLLFLTATPHKGDPENFALLLQLLDRDLYVSGDILAEASAHDEIRIMIRRLKDPQKLGRLKQELRELPDDLEDLTEAERRRFEDDLVERLTMAETMAELENEITVIERLVRLAKANENSVRETKFEELREVVSQHLSGRDERLLVFTEHKDALDFLVRKLTDLGFHCRTIHGGMPLDKRIGAEREFSERKPSIMVATEAAGEGINLQFCSLMVNDDIPGNPNRLEQRIGRIHRYKQQREVMIFNPVAKNTREGEVMDRLLDKLGEMRKALGSDRGYDVIGSIIPLPRFEALKKDWLAERRTLADILADLDVETDGQQVARIRADINDRSLGSRYIETCKLDADRQKSKEQRLTPEYIEKFFVEAYRSFGGSITRTEEGGRRTAGNRVSGVPSSILRSRSSVLRPPTSSLRLLDWPRAAGAPQARRATRAALRQDRPELHQDHIRQGAGRGLLGEGAQCRRGYLEIRAFSAS
jgi:superfamily II DNA or RNA helicase